MNKFHKLRKGKDKRSEKHSIVNFVLVASKSGRYGGPFETSLAQVRLTADYGSILVAGYFGGDSPKIEGVNNSLTKVRHLLGAKSFFDVGSVKFFKDLWGFSQTAISHISFARGITTYLYAYFCFFRGAQVILQTHGMLTSRITSAHRILDKCITYPLLRKSRVVLALTETEKLELRKLFPQISHKIQVLGNPAQVHGIKGSKDRTYIALFAARLHPRKRVLDFAAAATYALERGMHGNYQVIGPDEGDLPKLQKLTRDLGNFKYLGSTDGAGVLAKLASSDVFVLTSSNEPWGNVLVSSLWLGKPVVISSSSHLSPLIEEFHAGEIFQDGDAKALALAIEKVLEPSDYSVYSENALKLAYARFSVTVVEAQLRELYSNLLSNQSEN